MLFGKNKAEQSQPAPAPQAGAFVFDTTAADFEQTVLTASMERPVIVDFWAPWCGPCKQLGPILEKVVNAANGAVLMAKIDIDQNQEIAAALRIQSIPTVYAFFQGRPVDAFQGAVPESQIKVFVDKLVQLAKSNAPDAIDIPEALKGAAQEIANGDFQTAQAIYSHILEQDPQNIQAYVGFVRATIAAGELEQAKQLVDNAPPEIAKHPTFSEAKTALELAQQKPSAPLDALIKKLETSPEDHELRFDLATAQFADGQREEAIGNLLEIVRRKRDWNEEAARKQLVRFFEAMGHADPLTVESRKKLSSILFS
jgi:putative thioredoxin